MAIYFDWIASSYRPRNDRAGLSLRAKLKILRGNPANPESKPESTLSYLKC
ncbi:hypothetical protein [Helicobacter fennelliae]